MFENPYCFVQHAFCGQGREYLLLIDRDAGEADPGSYTKCMYRFFQSWYPRYHTASVGTPKKIPPRSGSEFGMLVEP